MTGLKGYGLAGAAFVFGAAGVSLDFSQPTSTSETATTISANSFIGIVYLVLVLPGA
jgi:hypothetical protein